MKSTILSILGAMLLLLGEATGDSRAAGQEASVQPVSTPAGYLPTTSCYAETGCGACAPEACKAVTSGEDCADPECSADECSSCAPCGHCSKLFPCARGCELGDPWTLHGAIFGEDSGRRCCRCGKALDGITFGGWLSAGIYGNAHGAALNGPLGFNDVGDGFTFNQAWLYAEKAIDTGGCGFDWGFRVDYVFGVDGPDTQAFGAPGWDNGWDSGRDYGSALPQVYAELGWNDLSVKLGHFYTIIGWEVVTAPDNFFYTHAYTMYYGEPFTHTGVLASYSLCDDVTVHAGWTQGWDTGFNNPDGANTFLGGLSFPIGQKSNLTWAVTAGSFGTGLGDVYMNSLVWEVNLTDKLTYILQHDLGLVSEVPGANHQWYGINQYLQYQINDCWAAGVRFEWFLDDDGARISFNGPAAGDYYEVTAGLNWKPHPNVILRPEVRYDWFDGVSAPGEHPFNDGDSTYQFSGGFDAIFTY